MDIRAITQDDLWQLSEFWYDKMALLQQRHPQIRLLPDARRIWRDAMQQALNNDLIGYVATVDATVVGGIIATIVPNQPGLAPAHFGDLRYLLLDLHMAQPNKGLAEALLKALQDDLQKHGITQLSVRASTQLAVERSFWRAMGAQKSDDVLWLMT